MPSFSIAFVAPDENSTLIHKIVEADDTKNAMKIFFSENAVKFYSDDEQGFYYFQEDFNHPKMPAGSVLEIAS